MTRQVSNSQHVLLLRQRVEQILLAAAVQLAGPGQGHHHRQFVAVPGCPVGNQPVSADERTAQDNPE